MEEKMKKKVLYVDMDNVLVDFGSALKLQTPEVLAEYKGKEDEIRGIFSKMKPIDGAVDAMHVLGQHYDVYILSTAPWKNPSAWSDKLEWVHRYFGIGKEDLFWKRVILTHHKDLNKGDYLIDDRPHKNGAENFEGEVLYFKDQYGKGDYMTWQEVIDYLAKKDNWA